MTTETIRFKRDTAFRKTFFVPESFSHPAKCDAQLLIWIVEHYTEAGETILDPMFGSGTTMLACILGRNVIGVELEQKFVDMAKANWEQVRMKPQLGSQMGTCQILQGDARQLSNLLVDKCVFSPPFSEAGGRSGNNTTQVIRSKAKSFSEYSDNPSNIGNLPYGQLENILCDKIITSPPYAEAQIGDNRKTFNPTIQGIGREDGKRRGDSLVGYHRAMQDSDANISSLPYGQIDKIVTSPPFQEPEIRRSGQDKSREGYNYGCKLKMSSEHPDNISKLAENAYGEISSIITSPPYEGSISGIDEKAREREKDWLREQGRNPDTHSCIVIPSQYSSERSNIGNLKSTSYLDAMLQVYQQCYKVLKPQGLMILIVKPFIRNQKLVPLQEHTKQIAEKAGFKFIEEYHRILPSQSFWRVIYAEKYPLAPKIDREYVLVLKKGLNGNSD